MAQLVLNDEHLGKVLAEALTNSRHRLFISTADLKDVYVPMPGGGRNSARSIVELLADVGHRGVEVRVLHSGVPSGPFLQELKQIALQQYSSPLPFTLRRCIRMHAKAVIVDGSRMYLGSANLTGAGLGAKSQRRRNFEAGIWTDELTLIDPVLDMLDSIWTGGQCESCGRRDYCPVPLEEPAQRADDKRRRTVDEAGSGRIGDRPNSPA